MLFIIAYVESRSIPYFQIIQCSCLGYCLPHQELFKLIIWYALISSWFFTTELETAGVHRTTTMRSKWIFQTGTFDFVRKASATPLCWMPARRWLPWLQTGYGMIWPNYKHWFSDQQENNTIILWTCDFLWESLSYFLFVYYRLWLVFYWDVLEKVKERLAGPKYSFLNLMVMYLHPVSSEPCRTWKSVEYLLSSSTLDNIDTRPIDYRCTCVTTISISCWGTVEAIFGAAQLVWFRKKYQATLYG